MRFREEHHRADVRIGIFALAALLLAAGAVLQATAQQDNLTNARNVAVNSAITLNLAPKGTIHSYKVLISDPGVLRCVVKNWPDKTYAPRISFFNAEGKPILARHPELRVVPGPMFIQIGHPKPEIAIEPSFELTCSFTKEFDPSEPNDSFDTARPAQLGKSLPLSLDPIGEADFFKVEVPEPGLLRFPVQGWPKDHGRPYMWCYDEQRKLFREGEWDARVSKGKYFFQLASHPNPDYRPLVSTPLNIVFEYVQEADPSEPNETIETARPVELGTPATFTLEPRAETDFFRVEVPDTGVIRYSIAGWPKDVGRPYVWCFNPEKKLFRQGEWDASVAKGAYYFQVASHPNPDYRPAVSTPLTITFTFVQETDPSEPNGTIDSARVVELGKPHRFTLEPRAETDFVKLETPGPGLVRYSIPNWPKDVGRPYVWCYGADKKVFRAGEWDTRVGKGSYYFQVASHPNEDYRPVVSSPLDITFVFVPESDPSEPNESLELARAVELEKPSSFTLEPRAEVDWFKCEVPEKGVLRYRISGWPEDTGRPYVWCFGVDRKQFRSGEWDASVTKGTYYFQVASHPNADYRPAIATPLQITFSFKAESDTSEPNDTLESARNVELGKQATFTLEPRAEVDCFKLEAPGPGILRYRLADWPDGLGRPYVRCYDSKKVEFRLGEWDARVSKGPYYFQVSSHPNPDYRPVLHTPVGITFTFTSETDSSEPNDTFENARPAELGKPLTFSLEPREETDFFKVDFPAAGTARYSITNWPAGVGRPYVWMYGPDRKLTRQGEWDGTVKKGTYFFQVASHPNSDYRSAISSPLSITFTFAEETDPSEPNDRFENARPTEFDQPATLSLEPRGDVDILRLQAKEPGIVVAWSRGWDARAAGRPRPLFRIFGPDRVLLAEDVADFRVKQGVFYVEVSSHRSEDYRTAVRAPFTVGFTLAKDKDASEPNGTFDTARAVRVGDAVLMTFEPVDDVDILAYKADRAGIAYWSVQNWTFPGPLSVELFGEDRKPLPSSSKDARIPAGPFFLRLKAPSHGSTEDIRKRPVVLVTELVPDPDPSEPKNDGPQGSTEVRPDTPFGVYLAPSTDVDHFLLKLTRETPLSLQQTGGPPDVGLEFAVLTATGLRVIPLAGTPIVLPGGAHVIRARALQHPGGMPGQITLVLRSPEPKSKRLTFDVERGN